MRILHKLHKYSINSEFLRQNNIYDSESGNKCYCLYKDHFLKKKQLEGSVQLFLFSKHDYKTEFVYISNGKLFLIKMYLINKESDV